MTLLVLGILAALSLVFGTGMLIGDYRARVRMVTLVVRECLDKVFAGDAK
jgi:hypothetical protein